MLLAAVLMDLPADVSSVRAGDVTGDGLDDLVFVSQHAQGGGRPARVSLTIVSVGADGRASHRESIALGDEALLWDIHNGLWGVDASGAVDLRSGERVVSAQTMLGLLGPTTPRAADIADDLNGDGVVELLLPVRGRLSVFTSGGEAVGGVPAQATGELSSRAQSGGTMIVAASTMPATVIGDIDGDGLRDLLFPAGRRAVGWRTTDEAGGEQRSLRLPVDLDPDDGPDRPDVQLARAWFVDLDGDGRLDLATHHRVSSGSWFGATARLTTYAGTGTGFGSPQVLDTDGAAFDVQLADFDGDGDQDLMVTEVDVGLANIGRALLARSMQVELRLYRMEGGRYPAQPQHARSLSWPIERPEAMLVSMEGDIDGDGWLDLVTNDAGEQLRVYPGSASGFATSPVVSAPIGAVERGTALLVRDLTGDGRAEILLWRPDAAQARILQVQP